MKRWNKKIACLLLAAGLCLQLSGCEALDTTLPDEEETAQSEEQDTLAVDPQGAVDQIYATLGRRIGLVEPTAEQLQSVVGLDPDDYTSAYVRYVETDFGADDVYIVLPRKGRTRTATPTGRTSLPSCGSARTRGCGNLPTTTFTIPLRSRRTPSSLSAADMW